MARQYGAGGSACRIYHAGFLAAGGIRAGATHGPLGTEDRHRDFSHVSDSAHAVVHSVVAHCGGAGIAGHDLVTGVGLSELYDSLLRLAADGVLQVDPERIGRRGDGRWFNALRGILSSGGADFDFGNTDRRDFYVHAGDAGVRLRADVHFSRVAADGGRGDSDIPGSWRRLLLGFAHGRLPDDEPTYCAAL